MNTYETALHRKAEELLRATESAMPTPRDALSSDDANQLVHDLQVHQIELELQNEELRYAQVQLEASRARYFDLYELAPVGYFSLNEKGVIREVNLTGATLLGFTRSALVDQPFIRFIAAEDADGFHLFHRDVVKGTVQKTIEVRMTRANADRIHTLVRATPAVAADGAAECRVVVTDVTALKSIEQELRYSQSFLQTASEVAKLGGWRIRLPQSALGCSEGLIAILEFPSGSKPLLSEVLALVPSAGREMLAAGLRACGREGSPFDMQFEARTFKHRRIYLRAIGKAVRDAYGAVVEIEGAFQDITEGRNAEAMQASLAAQLRESQKMEAIGTLAGGIAHDFNNVISSILGNAELARQDAGENWQALVSLTEIQKAGHRGRDLVEQILAFSRRQPTLRRVIALAAVVDESVRFLRAGLPAGITVVARVGVEPLCVLADPTQVQQVLLNLGANAAYAMQGQTGTITVGAEAFTVDEAEMRSKPGLKQGRYARIVVTDTGRGMDAATRRRIFEPFFTTKPVGQGTGLGMAVVHGIMQGHDGSIIVQSEARVGTTIELYFPLASAGEPMSGPTETASRLSEGIGKHVIYIDDEVDQAFVIRRTLERWGYRVSTYVDQSEAIAAAVNPGNALDLVITDFNMPGLSGIEVTRRIRVSRSQLPVVLVSGYVNEALRAQAAAAGVSALIEKTYEVEDLRDVLQRLTSTPAALGLGSH